VIGRATLEAVLLMSAEQVAGPHHPGKARGPVRRHGWQRGVVTLSDRKVRVEKPRLRRKGPGVGAEVEVPAYAAMQADGRLRERILEILMHGVSTRSYREVLPELRPLTSRRSVPYAAPRAARLTAGLDGISRSMCIIGPQCAQETSCSAISDRKGSGPAEATAEPADALRYPPDPACPKSGHAARRPKNLCLLMSGPSDPIVNCR